MLVPTARQSVKGNASTIHAHPVLSRPDQGYIERVVAGGSVLKGLTKFDGTTDAEQFIEDFFDICEYGG